ncbi:MAG: RnfABCDGE type electron transport complex subunit D [Thermodesulfobacteriota bacterium]
MTDKADNQPVPKKPAPQRRIFLIQAMMMKVVAGLLPALGGAVYFFGWRAALMTAWVLLLGVLAEGAFVWRQKKPVTSAVFVTSLIFSLSLPPTLPFWMAAVGIVFGVVFGKMVFGGTGHNVYNPAMVGRCFIYVAFPVAMTGSFVTPFSGGPAGLEHLLPDAVTSATPLRLLHAGGEVALSRLVTGDVAGSLGETSVILLAIGGIYILLAKAANFRLFASFVAGGILATLALRGLGVSGVPGVLLCLSSGAFAFGAFFVITEPISGPKTNEGRIIYGLVAGALVVVLRRFSNFAEGVMFAVLFVNTFAPILDIAVKGVKAGRANARAAGGSGGPA